MSESDQPDDGPSERLQLSMDKQTVDYLRDIAKTGTYGRTHPKVAKALIEEGVRRAIADGLIMVVREQDSKRKPD